MCVQQRRSDDRSGMRQLQVKAAQSIKRAQALLREMDTLRNQVADVDLQTFDNSMNPSRHKILDAIDMFKSYFHISSSYSSLLFLYYCMDYCKSLIN